MLKAGDIETVTAQVGNPYGDRIAKGVRVQALFLKSGDKFL